ncbi:hypothetical protein RIF29_03491 [Crotalaria pallida]|uniref:Uncharacterized protein n=1 Tax=Crotalaria pallida TaxID=3830 RepID=A0AAN9P9B8_CROPI
MLIRSQRVSGDGNQMNLRCLIQCRLCRLVGGDASRSYFHRQRPDPKLAMPNQSNNDSRSQAREEDRDKDRDVGDEANLPSQTFEGLKKNFNDEIVKLAQ